MNIKVLVIVLLGLLVLMSFVQGIHIRNLEKSIEEGVQVNGISGADNNVNTQGSGGFTTNVPSMVGGC
jgi:hypothetical protein